MARPERFELPTAWFVGTRIDLFLFIYQQLRKTRPHSILPPAVANDRQVVSQSYKTKSTSFPIDPDN